MPQYPHWAGAVKDANFCFLGYRNQKQNRRGTTESQSSRWQSPCPPLLGSEGTREDKQPEPPCQHCTEPQRRKSASVPGAEQPLPACWLPARLCCIITPAQMANDFVLSSLMSRRRTEQVCSLAAWPFRLPHTKEERLWALQQHKKGGCFPKNHHFGEQTGHAGHLRLVASHGLGSPSISCSLTHPALSPPLPCCDTDTLCWEGRRFLPCSEGTAKK